VRHASLGVRRAAARFAPGTPGRTDRARPIARNPGFAALPSIGGRARSRSPRASRFAAGGPQAAAGREAGRKWRKLRAAPAARPSGAIATAREDSRAVLCWRRDPSFHAQPEAGVPSQARPQGETMSATILERIQAEMVKAMKEKSAETLSTLRMLKAALMEAKTAKPRDATLTGEEEIEVLQRYVKKRRETMEINAKAGRADLNPSEEREIAVTQRFLPEAISEERLRELVAEAVASTGAAGPKDMGKVIGAVMAQVKGRAEGSAVSRLVKQALGG